MSSKKIGNCIKPALCVLLLAGAACSRDDAAQPADPPANANQPEEVRQVEPAGNAEATFSGGGLTGQVQGAIADLTRMVGVSADAIAVREARTVNWGSSAIGCPEKGKGYTQQIVPGVLLLLDANGKTYRYHGRAEGNLFFCPDSRAQAPAYGQGQEFM